MRPLKRFRGTEYRLERATTSVGAQVSQRARQNHLTRVLLVGVIHEVAADEIVVVAEAVLLHPVGNQQQPRVLHAARCKNVVARAHFDPFP